MPLTSSDYSLLLYTSIKTGKNFVADITDLAQAWQRTTRLVGGYWLGAFDITEQPSVVQDIFYNHIGRPIGERSGGGAPESTLQFKRSLSNDMRAWDAILKATELGDASGNPWRSFVDTGRRFFYEPVSTTPLYYLKGGARRRRAFENMANYVFGGYIDDTGAGP